MEQFIPDGINRPAPNQYFFARDFAGVFIAPHNSDFAVCIIGNHTGLTCHYGYSVKSLYADIVPHQTSFESYVSYTGRITNELRAVDSLEEFLLLHKLQNM